MPQTNPWGDVANTFNDMTRNLIAIKGQNIQSALSEAELAMRGNQFQQTKAIQEEANRLHRANLPIGQTDYSPTMHTRVIADLKNKTGLGKSIDDFANNHLTPYSMDRNARLDSVYDHISSMDKNQIDELMTNVASEHEAKLTKDPNYGKTRQAKATEAFINALYQAQDGSQLAAGFMPEVGRARAIQEANSKAALMQIQASMSDPERQFLAAKSKEYTNSGLAPEAATVKAYQDLNKMKAETARAGKIDLWNGGIPRTGAAPSAPLAPGEMNTNALHGLTPTQQETVKAIVEYRFPVSNLRNKQMMALVQRAYQYDPTFDAKEYATRAGVRKDFTSGKASQTILSLNTAVGHLNSLAKAANDLDNAPVQLWNKVINAGFTATGDPRVTKFNTAANAVAGELATVFKNTSGTDQEIKSWHDKISSSQSPEQLKANINEAIHLIGSRLEALHNKYEQGMGRKADFQILSPKSRQILQGLGVDMSQYDPAEATKQPESPETPRRRESDKKEDFRKKYNY